LIFPYLYIRLFSGVVEKAEIKGRQTLLRRRANHIADYEALHHIHFWKCEPEPKHIYYFGQSKAFEEWYTLRKGDQSAIYKGFEEKTTFTKRTIFKERNFDNISIWKYDNIEIGDNETKKNNLKVNIENLSKKLKEKEMDDNEINNMINELIKEIDEIETN
jgi:hypothetical protein